MNYSEQEYRLAREVLYLHSLWHQGPPSSNPSFSSRHTPCHGPTLYLRSSFSNPNSYFHPNPNPSLYCTNHQTSRCTHERCSKRQKKDSSPENEWPCDPASVPGQSPPHTWPPFEQAVQNPTLSPNSAGRDALISTQLSAIQSCKNFFSQDSDSESESECELGSDYDVDEFFMGLFENDVGLRGCYEKDRDNGEFYCLVCEARRDGNKGKGKMYRGCAALAQHASAIRKISRRAAHRALARSICRVLGWDLQRLPSIVLLPGSVVKANHSEVEHLIFLDFRSFCCCRGFNL